MVEARFDCPEEMKAQFVEMCAARGETPGALLRALMDRELNEWSFCRNTDDGMPEEQLLASLRKRVVKVWARSKTWDDLISGLELDELLIKPSGNGLIVCALGNGRKLANASQVGPGYRQMVKRFGCGFPNHPRPQIAKMLLGGRARKVDLFDDARTQSA